MFCMLAKTPVARLLKGSSRSLHQTTQLLRLSPIAAPAYKRIEALRLNIIQEGHRHQVSRFSTSTVVGKEITVTFIEPDGNEVEATGEEGTNLMELAHENDVDLEGACEGACACSTCHVILEEKIYENLPEPTDEEDDMLDLAFGLTDTSRLGCQVELTSEMEGMRIKLPSATRNFYVDGAKPAHH